MSPDQPIWRSMLFVPAHVEKFVASAHLRGADACILDLEDSVPLAEKPAARLALRQAVGTVSKSGSAVLVRVNEGEGLVQDLPHAVGPGVSALMVPKVESAHGLVSLDAQLDLLEGELGMPRGYTRLIAQIEHVRALPRLDEIATCSPRLMGMILGSEDFAASAGMRPTPETLYGPNQQVLFACRRAGLLPFGYPGSISLFRDPDAFREIIRRARDMGFVGGYAIHPDQVAVMNELFAPSSDEIDQAKALIAAYEQASAEGRGAFEFRGRMVDLPVVTAAREIVVRSAALSKSTPMSLR